MLAITPIETPGFALLSYVVREPLSQECLIIDPPRQIGAWIGNGERIKTVVNTHIHFDHTQGNPHFRGRNRVLAHRAENSILMRAVNTGFTLLTSGRIQPPIDFTLNDGDRIMLGDVPLTVLHTPGHSPGSICLYWPGNLIAGDTIFAGGIGRTDIPLGNSAALKRSISRLMELPEDTLVWPGHNYGTTYPVTMQANRRALVWALNTL